MKVLTIIPADLSGYCDVTTGDCIDTDLDQSATETSTRARRSAGSRDGLHQVEAPSTGAGPDD